MRNYNLLVVILFSLVVTLISCGKENLTVAQSACDVSIGTDELEWLDDMVADLIENNDKFEYIMMSHFEGETVFYYRNCDPVINYSSNLLNCKGEPIKIVNEFEDDLTDSVVYWKHDESACNI